MPPLLDPRMMWVLGQVTISGDEGISIKQLFDGIDHNQSTGTLDLEEKGELWDEILERNDLLIGDDKGHQAMIKKNLCLQDVFDFGLQERKITIRKSTRASQSASTPQTEAPRHSEPTPTPSFHTAEDSSPTCSPENHAADGEDSIVVEPRDALHTPRKPSTNTTQEVQASGPEKHTQETSVHRGRKPSKVFEPSADASNTPSRSQRTRKLKDLSPDPTTPGNNQKYLRHAIFTPYEEIVRQEDDIQRKAGVTRVYIDPYGSEPPKPLGRPKKQPRMIAVFKSHKLKIKNWLTSHARDWVLPRPSVEQDATPVEKPKRGRKPKNPREEGVVGGELSGESKISDQPQFYMQPAQQSQFPPQQSQTTEQILNSYDTPQQMYYPVQFFTPQHQAQAFSQQRTFDQQPTPQWMQFESPHTSTPKQYDQAVSSSAATQPSAAPVSDASKAPSYQTPHEAPALQPYVSPYAAAKATSITPSALSYTKSVTYQYQPPLGPPRGFSSSSSPTTTTPQQLSNTPQATAKLHNSSETSVANSGIAKTAQDSSSLPKYAPILPPVKNTRPVTPQTSTAILPPKSTQGPATSQTQNLKRKVSISEVMPAKRQQTGSILPPQRPSVPNFPLAGSPPYRDEAVSSPAPNIPNKDAFEKELAVADGVTISDISSINARFAAKYQDAIGNVVLRKDEPNFDFLRSPTNASLLTVPIARFTKYPIISQKGSNPMELFVYMQNEDGTDTTYRFDFGRTLTAFEAANNMRAKLSAAWTFHQKNNENGKSSTPIVTEQMKKVYPFFCPNEGCGKRWKNKEGLIYHSTKSNTPCAKNYDPTKRDGRKIKAAKKAEKLVAKETEKPKAKKQRKKQPEPSPIPSIIAEDPLRGIEDEILKEDVEVPENSKTATRDEEFIPDEENEIPEDELTPELEKMEVEYQSDSSTHSSVQSDLEWAWKVAQSQQNTTSKRRQRSTVTVETSEETARLNPTTGRQLRRQSSVIVDAEALLDAVADIPGAKRRKIKGPSRRKSRISQPISDNEVEDEETSDGVIEMKKPSKGRKSSMNEETREKLRRATKRRWAAIKASGGTELKDLKNCLPDATPLQFADARAPKTTKGLTAHQKQLRAVEALETHEQTWHQEPPLLQSAETTTWSELPAKVKNPPQPRRRRLPEPITYMQDEEDGSWSIRPFGHGVNPIHTRPSRQTVGNPHSATYTNRRDNGFRPVLEPKGHRQYLPGLPSKHILGSSPSVEALGTKRDSMSASLDDSDFTPQASKRARTQRNSSPTSQHNSSPRPRISKATGRPIRNYNRKVSGRASVETGCPSISAPSSRPKRETRKPARIQESYLAQSIESPQFDDDIQEIELPANPGLDSLPDNFGLGGNAIGSELPHTIFDTKKALDDRVFHVFHQPPSHPTMVMADIEGTEKWEQGAGKDFFVGGKVASTVGWINHTLDSQESADPPNCPITLRGENTFTVETLPYSELESLNLPVPDAPTKPQDGKPELERHNKVKETDIKDHQTQKTRFATVVANKFGLISDDPLAAGKELGFNVVPNDAMAQKRQRTDVIPRKDQLRLMAAIVAVRVITGGQEQTVDWILVATLFKDYSFTFLKKSGTALLKTKQAIIENFTSTFQTAFLSAYKNGELPAINFDDLPSYDWKTVVDWTLKKLKTSLEPKHFDLPDTRKAIGKDFEVTEKPPKIKDREVLFKAEPAAYAKIHYLSSVPQSASLAPSTSPVLADEMEIDEFTLAKSLVRAAAFTPEHAYDSNVARGKLRAVNKAVAELAIAALRKEKIISTRKEGGGRLYQANGVCLQILERKQLNAQQFSEAINFKRFLDSEYADGKECVRAEYTANEGTSMCLTQLQAHGRIHLQPVLVPATTTNSPPSFQIDIYPTETYISDEENDDLQNAINTEPPRGGPAGEIPVWYGITDEPIPDIWAKVIISLSSVVALRVGSSVDEIKTAFKLTLEEWEIRRLLEWGVDIGLFERLHKDMEGWIVGEWWWAMAGHFGEVVRDDDDDDDDDDDE